MSDRTPIDVSTQQLRVFLVLGEELHFGRTSDRLMLSQPYVSRTLAALERRVGGRLLDRTSRNVRLTPLGARLHRDLSGAYQDLAQAIERARAAASGAAAVLVVGCTTTTAGTALTGLVSKFEAAHPEFRVRLRELALNHPFAALKSADVDVLAFWLPDDEPDLVCGPVIEEQVRMLAMRRGHPLSDREVIDIEDIAEYGIPAMAEVAGPESLKRALWPTFTPNGLPIPHVGTPCRTISEMADVIARTDLVKPTVLAFASAARSDLVFRPIANQPPLRLGPIWLASRNGSEKIKAFADAAAQIAG